MSTVSLRNIRERLSRRYVYFIEPRRPGALSRLLPVKSGQLCSGLGRIQPIRFIGITSTEAFIAKRSHQLKVRSEYRQPSRDGYWKRWPGIGFAEADEHRQALVAEQRIYRKLSDIDPAQKDSIVSCIASTGLEAQFTGMEEGNIREFRRKNKPLTRETRKAIARGMADGLHQLHEATVFMRVFTLENFWRDSEGRTRIGDFTHANLRFTPETAIFAHDAGIRVWTELAQLGSALYELETGKKCYENEDWWFLGRMRVPPRHWFPNVEHLWMGDIIDACWSRRYDFVLEAVDAIDALDLNAPRHTSVGTAIKQGVRNIAATCRQCVDKAKKLPRPRRLRRQHHIGPYQIS